MLKDKFKIFLPAVFVFAILLILFPIFTLAAELGGGAELGNENNFPNPLNANDLTGLFVSIANWIAGIAATLAVLLIVIAGLQYIFSGGDVDKIEKANKTIKWSIIGLIIILMSWSLLKTVLTLLNVG
ncbi:pilin [Patescibacteria group bacterium]|nr:pilin [Patescibacteria group bacterium]